MRAFALTETEILDLPLDVLALEVLRDVHANGEWHQHNWMNLAVQSRNYGEPALSALEEAWGWLRANVLVAHKPNQSSEGAIFVTRAGLDVLTQGLEPLHARQRLAVELHPAMPERVRSQYLLGDFELAVFAAFRSVEERVRELAGADDGDIGVQLMTNAFKSGGPLSATWLEGGEVVARMQLFAGALGVFKNPASHRTVLYRDATAATEAILLADLLHRVLDDYESD